MPTPDQPAPAAAVPSDLLAWCENQAALASRPDKPVSGEDVLQLVLTGVQVVPAALKSDARAYRTAEIELKQAQRQAWPIARR